MLESSTYLRRLIAACRAVIVLACLVVISGGLLRAQIENMSNMVQTPTPGSGHDYFKLLSETANPQSGTVSIRIGVPLPPRAAD